MELLAAENARLRQRLEALERARATTLPATDAASVATPSPNARSSAGPTAATERLALFRRLFRGREDVYATRWEQPAGRCGYAPALRPGVPRGRGVTHAPEDYLPLTDDVVRSHLVGTRTVGVYPLLADETCWFLAIDFDKAGWHEDVRAALTACDALGIPAVLERSRSGHGAHLWIFFAEPVAASLARNLGSAVLTRALDQRHQLGLDSYDRLFPSQDTLPAGGFGNLIALPLQGASRRAGNTVFLDRALEPFPDQWHALATLQPMTPADVQTIVREATRAAAILAVGTEWHETEADAARQPWTLPPSRRAPERPIAGPLPLTVQAVLAGRLFIETRNLPPPLVGRLRRLAAFQNPEFYRAQAMRLSTFGKPRIIDCSEVFPEHLALPRGCLDAVRGLLSQHGISLELRDTREPGTPIDVTFQGALTGRQQTAADALLAQDLGVLAAPTAFGKTVVAAWLIAARGVNTLILVHRQHLADHWRERLGTFLGLPPRAVGQIGAGRRRRTGRVDIALLQSLSRKGEVQDLVAGYGQAIVDECHHVPAFNFERVLREVRARYVVGLTATPVRKDGHQPIVAMQCGPVRWKADAKTDPATPPFAQEVVIRPTGYVLRDGGEAPGIQALYAALALDEVRTERIVADVLQAVRSGRSPLVLTERTDHLQRLAERLQRQIPHVLVLRGGMRAKQRRALFEALRAIPVDEPRVLVATGRYAGEGFDDARLDTLFLTLPISWRGTFQQYAGRLHREHAGKVLVQIYDYADVSVPVLLRMLKRRLGGYGEMGYSVRFGLDAASDPPGDLRRFLAASPAPAPDAG